MKKSNSVTAIIETIISESGKALTVEQLKKRSANQLLAISVNESYNIQTRTEAAKLYDARGSKATFTVNQPEGKTFSQEEISVISEAIEVAPEVAEPKKSKKVTNLKSPITPEQIVEAEPIKEKVVRSTQIANVNSVLQFIVDELKGWRESEPSYSCVGTPEIKQNWATDTQNHLTSVMAILKRKGFFFDGYSNDYYQICLDWNLIPTSNKVNKLDIMKFPDVKNGRGFANAGKEYMKSGVRHETFTFEGTTFTKGDKVITLVGGKETEAVFSHVNVCAAAPQGYAVIYVGKMLFERRLAKISKVIVIEEPIAVAKKSKKSKAEVAAV